uniref:Uncharacterized protein n=1 Tax=Gasterosteus aculeatus TaxID=69293 RepID=G3NVS2_GASAC
YSKTRPEALGGSATHKPVQRHWRRFWGDATVPQVFKRKRLTVNVTTRMRGGSPHWTPKHLIALNHLLNTLRKPAVFLCKYL